MVTEIIMTEDHKMKDGQEFKKGSKYKVYKGTYDEFVTDKKIAKPTKVVKQLEGDN